MGKVKEFIRPDDNIGILDKEIGGELLKVLFSVNARVIAELFNVNSGTLLSDYDNTPPVPWFIIWRLAGSISEIVGELYEMNQDECYKLLGEEIGEILQFKE